MIKLKVHYLLMLSLMMLLLACEKNKTIIAQNQVADPIVPAVPVIPVVPIEAKILLPIKIETQGTVVNLKYKDNTNLLLEIEDVGGVKILITYNTDSQPTKLEKYRDGKLFYVVYYERDNKKNVNKGLIFDYDDRLRTFTPKGFYSLEYNEQQLLTTIKYHNNNTTNNLIKACNRTYTPFGNILEMTTLNYPGESSLIKYSFDQKKGIAEQMAFKPIFALESDHWFLACTDNNILSYTDQKLPAQNITFSYEYNDDGYPSKMVVNKVNNVQSLKITYRTFK